MKMRCILGIACLALALVSCAHAEEQGWSWSSKDDSKPVEAEEQDYIAEESVIQEHHVAGANATEVEDVIDTILVSNRQGRNVEGFDEIYQDPNVKQALENGDDTQARNIIKDRLCSLGLMQCDGGETIDPKRPYVAPEDLIYAQPVDIKPIGRPIPSIPVRGPPRAYGPPKPISLNNNGPPRKVGYGGPIRPGYGPPPPKYGPPFIGNLNSQSGFSSSSHNSFSGSTFEGPSGPTYLSKPPGPIYESGAIYEAESPYEFERPIKQGFKDVKQSHFLNSHGAASAISEVGAVQQHVHHHYHHGEDAKKQTVIVNNPVPVPSESHIHSSGLSSSLSGGYQSGSGFNSVNGGGFSPVNSGFGSSSNLYNSVKPVYENSAPGFTGGIYSGNKGQSQSLSGVYNLGYASGSGYAPSSSGGSFGTTVGSYGNTNQFYKKELNTAPANNNLLGGGSSYAGSNQYSSQFGYTGNKYNGQETGRAENYDCVCVPYDQCPSQDIIGRKDDLFLPIDPRNLNKDIDALPEDKVVITDGNGTMTVVRVAKNAVLDNVTDSSSETKKVSKREANDKDSDSAAKANIEPRQRGSDDDDSRGLFGKKIQPTFGVSFGLPHSGYGGYPLNPYGPNPIINPYGSSIGGGGLNLGLVSVDPLVSVQVTKNDYGEKVIKPLVNLHVTPNENIVHKIGSFLNHKKELLFHKKPFGHFGGGHGFEGGFGGGFGGGYGGGYEGLPIQHNHYHYNQKPHYHHGPPPFPEFAHPPVHRPPFYNSHEHSHPPPFYGPGPYSGGFRGVEFDEGGEYPGPYANDAVDFNAYGNHGGEFYGRSTSDNNANNQKLVNNYAQNYNSYQKNPLPAPGQAAGGRNVKFPSNRRRRDASESNEEKLEKVSIDDENEARAKATKRQAYYGQPQQQQLQQQCGPRHVCCRRPSRPQVPGPNRGQCGSRHSQGINGRIKNPVYVDGDSEFGEYPWQAAILKKDPKESVYVCGGTLIDQLHIVTAAHCVKTYTGFDLRVRLGEWDVNHDVEFFPYIERDVVSVHVHPQYYAGTLDNDLAILKLDHPVEWTKYPHISPACLPDKFTDFTGARCWTTGWGKDAFGDFGKYQNILKEVDVPIIGHNQCQNQLRQTRLGYQYQLNPGFICAGGEEGKDACKGDGGGPMVCERGGTWQLVGVVSWGIGCGQVNVPGVYVKVSHYLEWIGQVTGRY